MEQPVQIAFLECDDVVQPVASAAARQALGAPFCQGLAMEVRTLRHLGRLLRSYVVYYDQDDRTRAWGQASQISMGSQYGDRKCNGMSCQGLPDQNQGCSWRAGCITNTGWRKLLREVG